MGLEDILNCRAGLGGLPEKPVLITFDDGQQSVLEYALPLLEKYDMRAVAAVVGAYCDAEEGTAARSPEYSYLSWAEVAELAASGRFDIACHTQDMHRESSPRRGCLPKPGRGRRGLRRRAERRPRRRRGEDRGRLRRAAPGLCLSFRLPL